MLILGENWGFDKERGKKKKREARRKNTDESNQTHGKKEEDTAGEGATERRGNTVARL